MNPTTLHSRDIANSNFGNNVRIHQGDFHNHAAPQTDSCLADLQITNPYNNKTCIKETKGSLLKDLYYWILDYTNFKI
ncbi:hypothetical protein V8C37DRAFT_43481 [Trichoderma ceciliae]